MPPSPKRLFIMSPAAWPAAWRFARYALVGVSTFGADLTLCLMLHHWLLVPYPIAVAVGFYAGMTGNYLISRRFVFRGTARRLWQGYGYFALFALAASLLTSTLTSALVAGAGLSLLLARVLVAGPVGVLNYLINLRYNFMVQGQHHRSSKP
jgi:putative flippase GtrA